MWGPPAPDGAPLTDRKGAQVIIDADRLRYEMALRSLTAAELAHLASVNKNTLTRALSGRPVSWRTLRELSRVLLASPTMRMADVLLVRPS